MKNSPADNFALERLNAGAVKASRGDFKSAIGDFTRVIELKPTGVSSEIIATAYHNRAVSLANTGNRSQAIDDYGRIIGLSGALVEQVAWAYNNRGTALEAEGNLDLALKDYTAVILLTGVPVKPLELALNNRAAILVKVKKDYSKAIEDYSRVIQLPGASTEQICWALLGRGGANLHLQNHAQAKVDFNTVKQMSGALPEQVQRAKMLLGTGWLTRLLFR